MDMDEMIKACEETRREDETIVFAIGAGRIAPKLGMKKAQLAAMQYINDLEGFIGIHPVSLWRTLLLFDTLNHAKAGLNQMKAKIEEKKERYKNKKITDLNITPLIHKLSVYALNTPVKR